MSPHLTDLITARRRRRDITPRRFSIRTSKKASPAEIERLGRAFARAEAGFSDDVTGVEVSADRGCFLVVVETRAPERRVVRECEELFAAAWYDAFGDRSSPHTSWSSERPSQPAAHHRPARSMQRPGVLREA